MNRIIFECITCHERRTMDFQKDPLIQNGQHIPITPRHKCGGRVIKTISIMAIPEAA